jgi:hypothetical protein
MIALGGTVYPKMRGGHKHQPLAGERWLSR